MKILKGNHQKHSMRMLNTIYAATMLYVAIIRPKKLTLSFTIEFLGKSQRFFIVVGCMLVNFLHIKINSFSIDLASIWFIEKNMKQKIILPQMIFLLNTTTNNNNKNEITSDIFILIWYSHSQSHIFICTHFSFWIFCFFCLYLHFSRCAIRKMFSFVRFTSIFFTTEQIYFNECCQTFVIFLFSLLVQQ